MVNDGLVKIRGLLLRPSSTGSRWHIYWSENGGAHGAEELAEAVVGGALNM